MKIDHKIIHSLSEYTVIAWKQLNLENLFNMNTKFGNKNKIPNGIQLLQKKIALQNKVTQNQEAHGIHIHVCKWYIILKAVIQDILEVLFLKLWGKLDMGKMKTKNVKLKLH